ncbi:chemotaxis protein CheW [Spirochaetota bacterium]
MSTQTAEKNSLEQQLNGKKDRADKIDFKMVSFSLAGKEYGIDIMNVKEIAKAGNFTYVPNAAPFVRGVYNLRGDIISIIDLRTMFHLPAERKSDDALESLLILKIGEQAFGVIVDNIDKVIGVSKEGIQPPHPIFGDINIKYIKGIIENQNKLYIILNVEKLFASKEEEKADRPDTVKKAAIQMPKFEPSMAFDNAPDRSLDVNADFIKETLFSFRHFAVSKVNINWFNRRYNEWKAQRKPTDLQLRELAEADAFLEPFYSPFTGALWSADYMSALGGIMPAMATKSINVWNPGCGKGYESYSLAVLLKKMYPEARIKIWANDSDLLAISMAPNMVFGAEGISQDHLDFMVKNRNGFVFNQAIRDSIYFEFHDVINNNPIPPADLILCRDTLSFLSAGNQIKLLTDFNEKSRQGCILILGKNEVMPLDNWRRIEGPSLSLYVKAD